MKPDREYKDGNWVRKESSHQCDFCLKDDYWPTVFMAGPYWTHEECLIKVVEEGRRSPAW